MPATYVVFLVGALVVSLNIFTNKTNWMSRRIITSLQEFFSALSTLSLEDIFFFQKPPSCTESCRPFSNQPCVQHQHENPFSPTVIYWGTCSFTNHVTFLLSPSCQNLQSPGDHGIKWSDVQTDKARSGNYNVCVTKIVNWTIQNPVRPLQGECAVQSAIVLQPCHVAGFHGELG